MQAVLHAAIKASCDKKHRGVVSHSQTTILVQGIVICSISACTKKGLVWFG